MFLNSLRSINGTIIVIMVANSQKLANDKLTVASYPISAINTKKTVPIELSKLSEYSTTPVITSYINLY